MNETQRKLALLAPVLILVAAVQPARAQRVSTSFISYAGSEVSLASKASDDLMARINTPVMAGDRIQTGNSSRAEVILADGNVLRIDGRTAVRFDRLAATYESEDERDLVTLEKGSLSLETRSTALRETSPRIDTDDATVSVPDRSVVRVDAGRRGTEVYVLSGRVEIAGRAGRAVVRAGEFATVSGENPIEIDTTSLPGDRFSRFVEERRERASQQGGVRHVSDEFAYDYDQGDFEEYGSWTYVSSLDSTCWRPNVAAGWLPYSNGTWRWSPSGLTWVSYEPWGWLPFHFGSWSLDPVIGWCWLPGRHYAPAWVYWSYSPGWVGWCPMGYYSQVGHTGPSGRERFGRGGSYPHLAGRVDLANVDRRGWSFVGSDRFGTRFDSKDIVRGERLSFKPGHSSVIATAPLRVDRGSHQTLAAAIQDTVRRASAPSGATAGDVGGSRSGAPEPNLGLTEILRRDSSLSQAGRDELKRSWVRPGSDPALRAASAESIAHGTGLASAQGTQTRLAPRLDGGFRQTPGWREDSPQPFSRGDGARRSVTAESSPRRSNASTSSSSAPSPSWRESVPGSSREIRVDGRRPAEPGRGTPPRSDDGWRSSAAPEPRQGEASGRAGSPHRIEASQPRGAGDGQRRGPQGPATAPRSASPPASRAPAPSNHSPAPAHKGR
jgi:hypothetical protein